MLKRPAILDVPDVSTSLHGGELACSGNTCASGFSCNSVDSSGGGDGCSYTLGVGAVAAGVGVGVTVGIAVT
ncbi:hypothetical protein C8E03_102489 [Lachnotalea glycerini]|jgi:hypothetical protein|uniref:Uncharacterized protein n=1 Tax=Lachnotalea glycerini TaxID=1763509 RepID=A0A255I7Z1_9FIRM|nr:hypothetical protein [Lachnotalea glycerini]PXV93714.1 hypothetical protein C8E03_102489 [Lachnotalea glycerini]RDY32656.1 hypothetical protein CG710_004310 [Lachnotalea glycerini]